MPRCVLDGRATVFDGKARAVAADEQRAIREADDRSFAQHASTGLSTGDACVFGDDVEDLVERARAGVVSTTSP